jgi:signal transduction histidine kinase
MTLVVACALVIGALALVIAMRRSLASEVANAAWLRASDVAAVLAAGTPPELAVGDEEDMVIQLLDETGRVVAASRNIAGRPRVAPLEPGESARVDVPVDDDEFLAVATAAPPASGGTTVIVARTLETVDASTDIVIRLLGGGLPVLLVVVAVAGWHVIGRALAPVEAMRREVDEISATQLHRRVREDGVTQELGRLASTMNRMLVRLEQAQQRQRQFVSDASHELRSPLASIRQNAEVAVAHPDRVQVHDLGATVLAESLRLQGLVDDLLVLARVGEGGDSLRRLLDVDDFVFAEASRLRDAASGLHVDSSAVTPARVNADPRTLERAVRNIADNAARHAASRVRFGLSEDDGHVVLTVDDDGPGIAEADRRHIFERFVRLDAARSRGGGGAGLGLAIAAEVVATLGGTIAAVDSPLGGARLELRLPSAFSGDSDSEEHAGTDGEEEM